MKSKNSHLIESYIHSRCEVGSNRRKDLVIALENFIHNDVEIFVPIACNESQLFEEDAMYCLEDEEGTWVATWTNDQNEMQESHFVKISLLLILELAYWERLSGVLIYSSQGNLRLQRDLIEETLDKLGIINLGDIWLDQGADAYQAGDFEKARLYYEKSAAKGNVTALSNLGYVYYYGRKVAVNKQKARDYWEEAARCGDICATYKLGDMYRNKDLDIDLEKSKKYYMKAFEATKSQKEIYSYPDVYLRILKYISEDFDRKTLIDLAQDARKGFIERIEQGDRYSNGLLKQVESILRSLSK